MFLFAIVLITETILKLNLENEEVIIDTKEALRDYSIYHLRFHDNKRY